MKIIIAFFICCFAFSIQAQQSQKSDPEAVIHEIKNGALIVLLPTENRKVSAMQRVVNNPSTAQKYKDRLTKLIAGNQEKAAIEIDALVKQFNEKYQFSTFYLLPDTLRSAFEEGKRSGIFVNAKGKIDDTIEMKENTYAFLKKANTTVGSTTNDRNGLKAYVVFSESGDLLDDPFPYYYRINTLKYSFDNIIDQKVAMEKLIESIVSKLDKKLENYYEEVN